MLRDLGIVCQSGSTGGMRYAAMLAMGIKQVAPQIAVTLHLGRKLPIGATALTLHSVGVQLRQLKRTPRPPVARTTRSSGWSALWAACRTNLQRLRKARLQAVLGRHEVVHFAWPFGLDPPNLRAAMSFIPHDFIHAHEFGVNAYDFDRWTDTQASLGKWLACARPIVSSNFIATELARAFPQYQGPVDTIYLTCLHPPRPGIADVRRADATCRRLGVHGRFILCPNNVMPHKNLAVLMSALWHIRQAGEDVRLVAVGPGTDGIRAKVNCPMYGDRVGPQDDWHVRGLGLVSESDLIDLMQCALMVANPSLCEAGSGSGLDAWGCGCPVALADIPAFRDQARVLGTCASFFDPLDPRHIAAVLLGMIRDSAGRASAAEASRQAIGRYTWGSVAKQYLRVFETMLAS